MLIQHDKSKVNFSQSIALAKLLDCHRASDFSGKYINDETNRGHNSFVLLY